MIRIGLLAAAILTAFWLEIFFFPALGLPMPKLTVITLLFSARTVRQSAATGLGVWAGILLSLVSLEYPVLVVVAATAAAACARWLSVHYFSQRSVGTTFVLFLVCAAIMWSPSVFRAALHSLSASTHAAPLVREYAVFVVGTALVATLCHIPLLLWDRRRGTRVHTHSSFSKL